MKRIIFNIVLVLSLVILPLTKGFCVTQWNKGAPAATDLKSIWPATSQANNSILDSLLSNYQRGFYLTYTSSSTITALPGEVVVSNAAGTTRLFLVKSTSTAITSANIDTGAVASSTTYYIYAGTSTATDAAPTFYFSLSSSAPTGVTYYAQVGSFTTDSSSRFTGLVSTNVFSGYASSTPVSKSAGVPYQALTDGFLVAQGQCSNNPASQFDVYSDSSSSPSTRYGDCSSSSTTTQVNSTISVYVRRGDYYEFTSGGSGGATGLWTSIGR